MIKHPNFSMSPTVMKVAANAEWERAKIFRVEEYTGHAQLSSFVQNREEIACEAFFKDAFIGVRRRGSPQEILRFVHTFADITTAAQSGDELFTRLRDELHVPVAAEFVFAEIGAVEAWKSVGAFHIDDPKMALQDIDQLLLQVSESSVGKDTVHLKAIEFVFSNGDGTNHWIALPISEGPRIVAAMLHTALESFCEARE